MRIHYTRGSGFTLLEIMIVVVILGLLVTMAFPSLMRARSDAQRKVCIENLTQIEAAKQMFGIEKGRKVGDLVYESDLVGSLLYLKKAPECPADGTYDYGAIGTNAICDPLGSTDGHRLE